MHTYMDDMQLFNQTHFLQGDENMKLTDEQKSKLTKIAGMVKKAANPDNTGFDEKPSAEKNGPNPQVSKEEPKPPVEPAKPVGEEPAAVPAEEQQGPTMQDVMSVSARGFLGPEIFDAALNGDPNAQNMIALTAANVAVKMGEIYMRHASAAQEQAQVAPEQAQTTPEQESPRQQAAI